MSDTFMTGDRDKDDAQVLESPPHVPAPLPPASEWLKAGPEYMVGLKYPSSWKIESCTAAADWLDVSIPYSNQAITC